MEIGRSEQRVEGPLPEGEGSRLSSWLTAHEVDRTGRTGPTRSLLTVVLTYLLGFGLPIFAAIHYLSSAHVRELAKTSTGWSIPMVVVLSLNAFAVIVGVALLAREVPSWTRPIGPSPRWRTELKAFGLAWLAMFVAGIVTQLLGIGEYPRSHAAASAWPSAISSLFAGPSEEIVVLVVPLVFLRAAKWPWWQVIAAGLVLRLAYHVYYGFPAVGLTVWALAMIFIYLRTHAILGLIVAHSYWDMTSTVGVYWSPLAAGVMFFLPILALVIWGFVSVILWLVRRQRRKAEARRTPTGPPGWYQNDAGYWWWWDGYSWTPAPVPEGEPLP